MLSYATIEAPEPPTSVADGTTLAQFGKDMSVVYHQEGSWNTPTGGANVITNTSGLDTHKITIRTSGDYAYIDSIGTNGLGGLRRAHD